MDTKIVNNFNIEFSTIATERPEASPELPAEARWAWLRFQFMQMIHLFAELFCQQNFRIKLAQVSCGGSKD
ncbi:MAG: hypothetical protein AB1704_35325 [Pseudomonadota bacterium]|jgi:hypothetical protein|uniref:hypothetical protein n=1 Tax=Burkholderiaceae TaxID=119060 RepID=UPI0010F90298|nr:hypothetical protein [Burkholderia sp. 4M9327F10]